MIAVLLEQAELTPNRGQLPLDILIQLATIYEQQALKVRQKLEHGAKVYAFELGWLNYWNRLTAEISERKHL